MTHLKQIPVQVLLFLCILVLHLIPFVNAQAINLVVNSGAEIGWGVPDNWTSTGTVIYENFGHSGLHSLAVDDSGSWISTVMLINHSSTYFFSFWVNGTVSLGDFFVHVRPWIYPNGTGWIGQINYPVKASYADWEQVNDTITFPSNAQSATIEIMNEGTASGEPCFDDFVLSENIPAIGFFQGTFAEFMFGSGSWFGLLLMCVLILVITAIHKYGGAIGFPIGILIALLYASNGLGWHCIIMFMVGLFVLVESGIQGRKR